MDLSEASHTSSDESSDKGTRLTCTFDGCHKKFTKSRKLLNHLRLHKGEYPFVCDVPECNKKYTNSSHFQRHKKRKHDHINEEIACSVEGCEKILANKCSLKKHILRCHNPQRAYPFTCATCQQGFYRKKQLQQHTYLHTGELPFSCDECDTKFLTPGERNKHKRIHKKYTCECGEICDKWNSYRAHQKICIKNLKCKQCEKIFSTKTNLKMHTKTHMDKQERNIFVCPYDDCERFYFHNTNLTFHVNSFHKKVPKPKIPCEYEGCNKLLSKMQNYKVHLRTHHVTNKPKFPRKPRKDKGIPKKTVLDKLCEINSSNEKESEELNLNKQTSCSGVGEVSLANPTLQNSEVQ